MPSTPTVYATGSIKRDPASGAVAIRTIFPEGETAQLDSMTWLVATPNIGAKNSNSEGVAGWEDLYVADESS